MDKEYLSKKVSKEQLYRIYEAVNQQYKRYHSITRKEMAENIVNAYQNPNIMKNFISEHEFEILQNVYQNHSIPKSLDAYELLNRFILVEDKTNPNNMVIDEELVDVLVPLFSHRERDGYGCYDDIILGLVNYFGVISYQDLFLFMKIYIDSFDEETLFNHLSSSSLLNYMFLCPSDYVLCRYDLFDYYDEIIENRNQNANSHAFPIKEQLIQFANYSMDTHDPKISNMLHEISILDYHQQVLFIEYLILYAHLGYDFYVIEEFLSRDFSEIEDFEIVREGYESLPSASFYGTYLSYQVIQADKLDYVDKLLESSNQANAHLDDEDVILFYELYLLLLDFINEKYHVVSYEHVIDILNDKNQYVQLRKTLLNHLDDLDEFINQNDELGEDKLEIISQFRYCIQGIFLVIKHEKDDSILLKDDCFYAVKGINQNLDELFNKESLPIFIETVLFPFKGKILVDSFMKIHQAKLLAKHLEILAIELEKANVIHHLSRYN